MYPVKQSTALTVPFFVHDANGDGVTGLLDAGFTKRIKKSGAWAAMTVTITETENGWYDLPLSTAHTDTLGILTISISHASAKRINLQFRVHSLLTDDLATPTNITSASGITLAAVTHTGAVIPTVTTLTNLPAITANWITAAGITDGAFTANKFAAASLNGKGDWNIGKTGYSLTATTGLGNQTANITGNLSGSVGSVTGAVGSVTGAVTVGSINADVITAASLAADAVAEIQAGLATSAEIAALPTATANADALLKRDMSAVTGEASRSPINALRFLRNKWSVAATTLTVTKEDDTTAAWTSTVTTSPTAEPITGSDPA